MSDLNDLLAPGSGWVIREAYGINDLGWIAATGYSAALGKTHALLLVPEPASAMLLLGGGLALLRRRFRR